MSAKLVALLVVNFMMLVFLQVRMLTSGIICAYRRDPKASSTNGRNNSISSNGCIGTDDNKHVPKHPTLPDTLAGWAE